MVRSDGGEDRAPCFASRSHRWRVMIMQRQTEGRGEEEEQRARGEIGEPKKRKKSGPDQGDADDMGIK